MQVMEIKHYDKSGNEIKPSEIKLSEETQKALFQLMNGG